MGAGAVRAATGAATRGRKIPSRSVLEFAGPLASGPSNDRIDRDNRIIRDVKISGFLSVNPAKVLGLPSAWGEALDEPYSYSPEALQDAVPLFEGVRVYIDHPESAIDGNGQRVISGTGRKVSDHFGRLVNVRFVAGDGLRGDLEYLASHPLAEKIIEAAERMPDQVGLSQRSYVEPVLQGNRVVVQRINAVQSVDLIAERPGTTKTLFESAPMELNEKPAVATATETDGEVAAGAAEADPKDAIRAGLNKAAMAIFEGDGTAAEKLEKLKPLLEEADKIIGILSGDTSAAAAAASEESAKNHSAGNAALEQQVRDLTARENARVALESAGVAVSTIRIKALAPLADADRTALIAEFKKQDAASERSVLESRAFPARSGGAGHAGAAAVEKFDPKTFVEELRAGA